MPRLYVVATPIGNLEDLSPRAQRILSEVDTVAAEDTRHTGRLLQHFNIKANLVSVHEHNERQRADALIARLAKGESIALVSDAGTPLISDPGFILVRAVREAGFEVTPVPGCCAFIAALSVSGLPSDRFTFHGFLPAKAGARQAVLESLVAQPETLIFYESTHRIVDTLKAMAEVFGGQRYAVIGRELTKTFETIHGDTLEQLVDWVLNDPNQQRGEFVVLVQGAEPVESDVDAESQRVVTLLAEHLPPKKAAAVASEITGTNKKALYQYLVQKTDH